MPKNHFMLSKMVCTTRPLNSKGDEITSCEGSHNTLQFLSAEPMYQCVPYHIGGIECEQMYSCEDTPDITSTEASKVQVKKCRATF